MDGVVAGPVEHVADLTCTAGHTVEVHWTEGEQAEQWQCPTCLEQLIASGSAAALSGVADVRTAMREAHARADEESLVSFGGRTEGDRELPFALEDRMIGGA